MSILITGIQGFVGSNLTKNWNGQFPLYGLDINPSPKEGVIRIFSWDELGKVPKVEAIVHLAGKAHDTKNDGLAEAYFQINTELTKKIFDYFLQSDAQTFIFFSSVKAAADRVEGEILTEDINPNPIGPYGESKILAEKYILKIGGQDPRAKDKKIYILRPCMIHGPGNKGNLNLLYDAVKKGIPWPLGAYENRRSFCSIDNIAFVVKELIQRNNVPCGIYHVSDDEALATNDLIGLICGSLGRKARIWRIPKGLMNSVAGIGSKLHLPLNKERLKKLTENYVVSNAKIKTALGIEKMPVSAREGLKKTLENFK
ncbi:MAG: NAD-dependent epimerase/dehydratase family protein [Dysgonamonadaceae bacterium]|jgi:nucleoside-diphosphate-sugar epimerase|nr:NAD-dependent epimerase/dehydratase family protein [Dysgonamonadaceae bacterium]